MNEAGETSLKLPMGWELTTYEQIGKWSGGGTPSKKIDSYWSGGDIPWISPKDMKSLRIYDSEDKISHLAIQESPAKLISSDSLLFVVRSGIIRRVLPVAITKIDAAINQDLKALTPSKWVFEEYLLFHALAFNEEIRRFCAKDGTTVESIEFSALKAYPVPLAPLLEQHRIVARIEELFSHLDAGVESLHKAKAQLRRYRQAVLKAAVEGKLTEEWRKAHLEVEPAEKLLKRILYDNRAKWEMEELAKQILKGQRPKNDKWKQRYEEPAVSDTETSMRLPDCWVWATVEQLASPEPRSIQSGPFGSALHHSEFQDSGVLAIGIDNVLEGRFSTGRQHRISLEKFEQLKKFSARPLDVLVTVMATVGRCCVVPANFEEAIITKHVYRISVNQRIINPYFLMNCIRGGSEIRKQISAKIRGQTRPGINGTILKQIAIPVPPLIEQSEIVSEIERSLSIVDHIEDTVNLDLKRIDSLRQSILKLAFEGRLVPQDPSDEPASMLLERIKAEKTEEFPRKARKNHTHQMSLIQ